MKNKFAALALIAMIATPTVMPTAASAKRHHRVYRNHSTPTYHRYRCDGGNGAVGTVAGGVGGALIGNAIGGDALGTIAGGVGGALLGRHLDKVNTRHRNGC